MMRAPAIHVSELEPRAGEPAHALVVLRFRHPLRRERLIPQIRYLASIVPDADSVIDHLAETTDPLVRVVALPWSPAEPGASLTAQRRLIESAGELGVDSAWFSQLAIGPAPQVERVAFPVDGRRSAVELFDRDSFGIAFKLDGPPLPGTRAVLAAFHALWLAPYRGRYRDAGVTHDPLHHAAHLWVEGLALPPAQLAGHLLWVATKIHDVFSIVHARFAGAPAAHVAEGFVLGGNPLREIYSAGGEPAADRWIADQDAWSTAEVARMLSALAREVADG